MVAGLVPDGYETVSADGATTRVERNTFILETPALVETLVLVGPAGRRTVSLGSQEPPGAATP